MSSTKNFINEGFSVIDNENTENKLLTFLKENYPSVIKDNEIDLNELKAIAGLPIDEKINGYGINFIGRNVARAKYGQKTEKELKLNTPLSKDIDTTQNLVLKGDNLDSLKILKNHYNGLIKCIYIDPPYNTTNDEFVYPDKFDKEEAEVLGLANLTESDMERMEFSFKSKKSHNGWLSFMYPRLLLARDLLSKDGAIFISIDDNEQANLKLLCDDVFGEENFVTNIIWEKKFAPQNDAKYFSENHDYILCYAKSIESLVIDLLPRTDEMNARYKNYDHDERGVWVSGDLLRKDLQISGVYTITAPNGRKHNPPSGRSWRFSESKLKELISDNRIWFGDDGNNVPRLKRFLKEVQSGIKVISIWKHSDAGHNQEASQELRRLFSGDSYFDTPKPIRLLKKILQLLTNSNDIILDFFAGSGTTGHAVMQINAEDEGDRKFVLCQIDEPIKEDKPAHKFCLENNLPPVISSITIERLKRAGEKIKAEIDAENSKAGMFEENKKEIPDIGFKVFDSIDAPKLELEGEQITIKYDANDTLSRIYNMIFRVGIDEPTQVPETVVEDCIYKIGTNYYITNSAKVNSDDFSNAIKNGKVFIDGWTASLNGTLHNFKEDVKIVF